MVSCDSVFSRRVLLRREHGTLALSRALELVPQPRQPLHLLHMQPLRLRLRPIRASPEVISVVVSHVYFATLAGATVQSLITCITHA